MKATFKRITFVGIVLFALSACKSTDPQVKLMKIKEIDEKIASSNYTFEAQRANPMSGGKSIHLTSIYTLKVTPDSIIAHLPYFGRAYSAPINSEGGIKFTSTNFDYEVSEKKKGVSRISIKVKDNQENYKLSLLIGETGSSTLYVDQNNKQGITFMGDIH